MHIFVASFEINMLSPFQLIVLTAYVMRMLIFFSIGVAMLHEMSTVAATVSRHPAKKTINALQHA